MKITLAVMGKMIYKRARRIRRVMGNEVTAINQRRPGPLHMEQNSIPKYVNTQTKIT